MADLRNILRADPTLQAVDDAIAERAFSEKPRPYLGMSEIGEECSRRLWYSFRHAYKKRRKAFVVKCAERGHIAEDLQAKRLRLLPFVSLTTHDETGKQFEFSDHDGHFKGHCDGVISGLIQAPKAIHIWEHKEKEEKYVAKLRKLKTEMDEKKVLRLWMPVYYAQAVLYMWYKGLTRHYMTVTVPGGRETESIRTNEDMQEAIRLKEKAKRIINSQDPPDKIGAEDYFTCKMCDYADICHRNEMPDRGCRTCLHSTPVENAAWHCERFGKKLTHDEQIAGCPAHKFIPSLVPGEVLNANSVGITYRLHNGTVWEDRE